MITLTIGMSLLSLAISTWTIASNLKMRAIMRSL